ncbi:MAG: hypothetical protein ACYCTE_08005, partial [Acidimicrobiales bacterium]
VRRERGATTITTQPRRTVSWRRWIRAVTTLAVLVAGAVALGYKHRELAGALRFSGGSAGAG